MIYSGIHYDATSLAPMLDCPEEFHQTIMSGQGATKKGEEDEEDEDAADDDAWLWLIPALLSRGNMDMTHLG